MAAIGGLLKVISLISATIGIVNFIKANEPDKKGPYDSVVRIAVGLNNKNGGLQDANGWSPMILAFNELGDPCGVSRFDSLGIIPDGSYRDITIHQKDMGPGQQPTNLQIMASNDALCIAYVSQTWPDGATRGWLGDTGKLCNETYFLSNIIVGEENHKPYCTWLDNDHSDPRTYAAAMQIHMEDFIHKGELKNKSHVTDHERNYFCRLPAMLFKYKHNYIYDVDNNVRLRDHHLLGHELEKDDYTLWTGPREFDAQLPNKLNPNRDPDKRRSIAIPDQNTTSQNQTSNQGRKIREFFHLVVSSDHRHDVRECCADPRCQGPDIVNLKHGYYCDQSTKTHMPLCKNGTEDGEDGVLSHCFHLDTHHLIHEDMDTRTPKNYTHEEQWD